MEQSAKTDWWRWIVLPPGAILAAMAGGGTMLAFQWLTLMFNWGSTNGWYFRYIVPVFVSGAAGYAFGVASCAIAPRAKRTAGIVMATLLGVVAVVNAISSWVFVYTVGTAIQSTIASIVILGSAIAAVSNERQ